MPIGDISGLMSSEKDKKIQMRKSLKKFFYEDFSFPEDSTTITFITDETTGPEEHLMMRLYSGRFLKMNGAEVEAMCNYILPIMEEAGHPYNEIILPFNSMIFGRWNKKVA